MLTQHEHRLKLSASWQCLRSLLKQLFIRKVFSLSGRKTLGVKYFVLCMHNSHLPSEWVGIMRSCRHTVSVSFMNCVWVCMCAFMGEYADIYTTGFQKSWVCRSVWVWVIAGQKRVRYWFFKGRTVGRCFPSDTDARTLHKYQSVGKKCSHCKL